MTPSSAGAAPDLHSEHTVMTVMPSLAARADGRALGRIYLNDSGIDVFGIPVTIGRIIALLSAPFVVPLFFLTLNPFSVIRYRLTNRRLVVEKGWRRAEVRSVALDRFDNILIDVQPGQKWYRAGDLVFRLGQTETFRLAGVPNPEPFRHTCLKAHHSYVGVQKSRPAVGV
jgi:Bacterial PH domain